MICQKHLFQLPEDIHYLNCGYMSPLLKSAEEAGIAALQKKRNPTAITSEDFFNEPAILRQRFGELVNCKAEQLAIIPSASYGLQNAVNNIPLNNGDHAITIADEFPSGYFAIKKWCEASRKELKVIDAGKGPGKRGGAWNEKILNSITNDTAAVLLSSIHWTDGTLFDLKAIGSRCSETNTVFIVDGTQSVGALPVDVEEYNIDALVCAAYKWLLGPYAIGAAYYHERFNNGTPIEESWLNRVNAENFSALTNYANAYKTGAARYSMGENSQFNLTSMFIKSIEQILSWREKNIQAYSRQLTAPLIKFLEQNGAMIEEDKYRAGHLFGFTLPGNIKPAVLAAELQKKKVFVSVRGDAVRISTHLYNNENDIKALMDALKSII